MPARLQPDALEECGCSIQMKLRFMSMTKSTFALELQVGSRTTDGRSLRVGSGRGQFNNPSQIRVDERDRLVIADTYNQRVLRFTPRGSFIEEFDLAPMYPVGALYKETANTLVVASKLVGSRVLSFHTASSSFLE